MATSCPERGGAGESGLAASVGADARLGRVGRGQAPTRRPGGNGTTGDCPGHAGLCSRGISVSGRSPIRVGTPLYLPIGAPAGAHEQGCGRGQRHDRSAFSRCTASRSSRSRRQSLTGQYRDDRRTGRRRAFAAPGPAGRLHLNSDPVSAGAPEMLLCSTIDDLQVGHRAWHDCTAVPPRGFSGSRVPNPPCLRRIGTAQARLSEEPPDMRRT